VVNVVVGNDFKLSIFSKRWYYCS